MCLLSIMRVIVWTTRSKRFYGGEELICFFKHQPKVKIRVERAWFPSSISNERCVRFLQLVRVRGADLECLLHAP